MDILSLLQWPAMVITLAGAWLTASQRKGRRSAGFWCYLVSTALWTVWGIHDHAWALIALQLALGGMNIRGIMKNDAAT